MVCFISFIFLVWAKKKHEIYELLKQEFTSGPQRDSIEKSLADSETAVTDIQARLLDIFTCLTAENHTLRNQGIIPEGNHSDGRHPKP